MSRVCMKYKNFRRKQTIDILSRNVSASCTRRDKLLRHIKWRGCVVYAGTRRTHINIHEWERERDCFPLHRQNDCVHITKHQLHAVISCVQSLIARVGGIMILFTRTHCYSFRASIAWLSINNRPYCADLRYFFVTMSISRLKTIFWIRSHTTQ